MAYPESGRLGRDCITLILKEINSEGYKLTQQITSG